MESRLNISRQRSRCILATMRKSAEQGQTLFMIRTDVLSSHYREQLVTTVKKMLHEGNVRHIVIKQEGSTIMEMPLTFGVVGVLAAPVLAALGALGALIGQCSIEVVRLEPPAMPIEQPEKAV
jgi:hypothetical protein